MAHDEGDTVGKRLLNGTIPVTMVAGDTRQIAEGLDAAFRKAL